MNCDEAIDCIIGNGMAAIMVFHNLAVIETEQEVGSAVKYILYSD